MDELYSDNKVLGNKNSNPQPKEQQRKHRRKKGDQDCRNYMCACGKSYLSYPALYTHVKTKHYGDASITQKMKMNASHTQPQAQHNQFQTFNKPQMTLKREGEQEVSQIQKMRQFICKRFIKNKSKDFLSQVKKSLRLKQDQILYINKVVKLFQQNYLKPHLEAQPKHLSSNHKSQGMVQEGKQDVNQMLLMMQNTPQSRKQQNFNILRDIIEKSHGQNQKQSPKKAKLQRKGFSSFIVPIQQVQRRNINSEEPTIDEILGMFLGQCYRGNPSQQIITNMLIYFVCQVKQFFDRNFQSTCTSQIPCQTLIQQANEIVNYLLQIQNPYLRQPVTVCKMLFFFYRWMFRQRLTTQFVRFNEVGTFAG